MASKGSEVEPLLSGASPQPSSSHDSSEPSSSRQTAIAMGQGQLKRGQQQAWLGMAAALLYGSVAVAMNFVNKYAMQVYPLANVVILIQMVATWVILQPLQSYGILQFPPFSLAKARRLFWITAAYTANTCFALVGLQTLNVPMYNTLKRLTPGMVLVAKSVMHKRWPNTQLALSVAVVIGGCIVAGAGDLSFDLGGYMNALASCLSQALYLLLVEVQGASGIGTNELLYYNAITSLPMLVVVAGGTGELWAARTAYATAAASHGHLAVIGTVAACSLMGVLLNYTLFLCTTANSALTTTIVGVLKGVVAVALGFVLLGGVKFSWLNVSGIMLNTLGGIWYTYIKYTDKARAKAAAAQAQYLTVSTTNDDDIVSKGYGQNQHQHQLQQGKVEMIGDSGAAGDSALPGGAPHQRRHLHTSG